MQGQRFEPIFSPAGDPDAGFEQALSAARAVQQEGS